MKEILLFSIVVFLLSFFYMCYNHTILNIDDAATLLTSNDDGFFNKLNKINLYARKCTSIDEYKEKIKKSIIYYGWIYGMKRYILARCIYEINNLVINEPWISAKKFKNIPWKIIITNNRTYEYGLPHTRFDTIIIPDNMITVNNARRLCDTLFHEKLHVYQKMYPDQINKHVLKEYKIVTIDQSLNRANPDTDNKIYKHINTNTIYQCNFISSKPNNIIDVVYTRDEPMFEHPYEKMVYDLVQKYYYFY